MTHLEILQRILPYHQGDHMFEHYFLKSAHISTLAILCLCIQVFDLLQLARYVAQH